MSHNITPNEEQALDALLAELHGQPAPDLSQQILARLQETPLQPEGAVPPWDSGSSNVCDHVHVEVGSNRHHRTAGKSETVVFWKFAVGFAAIAATVLMLIWLGRDLDTPAAQTIATTSPSVAPPSAQPSNAASDTKLAQDSSTPLPNQPNPQERSAPKPLKGIPLAMEAPSEPPFPEASALSKNDGLSKVDRADRPTTEGVTPPPLREELKALTLVAKQIDTNLQNYWSSIGIQATQEASMAEITERLSNVLGASVPDTAIDSAESFQSFLTDPAVANAVAKQFMSVVTEGGIRDLEAEQQSRLVNELANSFRSNQPFDETLADWISGESDNSSPWYLANASDGIHPLARRLASLTMNVDLRCIKCHDSVIDSRGTQSEYWAFTGLLERSVDPKKAKSQFISPERTSDELVFYETLDGRQKVVEASIPASWIAGTGDTAARDLKQWSQRVLGSRELARGVVNSLWRMIHGRPLRGSVVDMTTPPHTESLGSLEQRLVDDLIQSRFNLGRSLALVVSASTTRRSIPLSLRAEQIAMSSQAEIDLGNMLVGAFAAAAPEHVALPVAKRVQFASQSIGVSLDAIRKGTMLLAQTLDSQNPNPSSKAPGSMAPGSKGKGDAVAAQTEIAIEQFPAKAAGPPVQWLTLIDNLEGKVDHLAYLVPLERVPESVSKVVDQMVAEETAPALILHRVWWMIHP
ncbi:hypothetical protein Pla52o_46160 [Novipirellula galeiformis]|uniref:DUF1549 domain-containing protein n=1 Tax=Novipirellula galeiformis TaxID=2528004 RepID=A0A5C6C7I7_9BACT|nr:hypothetical protein [Novipirellula galeiformis]TWU20102.1 hypothetical protein Pla52o_46160 [Novipirellula galeiformis]